MTIISTKETSHGAFAIERVVKGAVYNLHAHYKAIPQYKLLVLDGLTLPEAVAESEWIPGQLFNRDTPFPAPIATTLWETLDDIAPRAVTLLELGDET